MLHRPTLTAFALGLLLSASAWGQHHVMGNPKDYDGGPGNGDPDPPAGCEGVQAKITINGTSFSPSTVTIDAGQPVCWSWTQSVQHNVKADDGSFTSGSPATNGNFQRTFSTPGTYGFYCQVHGSLTGGMRGTVVVRSTGDGGGEGSGPGTIGFSSDSYTVDEGAGVVTIMVERAGGSDGAASVSVATAPGTAKQNKDYSTRKATLQWANGDGSPKTVEVAIKNDTSVEPDETFSVKLSKVKGAALGTAAATVTIHDDDGGGCAAATVADTVEGSTAACDESRALCLNGGRFEATVEWGPAFAKARNFKRVTLAEAPGSGFFSSPSREEPQVLVNVVDRCAENGHFGLDLAAVTDLELTVRVRDTQTGRTRVYFHPAGAAPSTVRDLEAFATCP
jgi:plastocyanin